MHGHAVRLLLDYLSTPEKAVALQHLLLSLILKGTGVGETTPPNNRNKKPPAERVVFISSVALVGRQVVVFRKTS